MVRNSVIRYFNKTWVKCLQYKDYPTYLVNLLSDEFLIKIGHNNIMIRAYFFVDGKYYVFPFSGIKTEKELLKQLTIKCNEVARIIRVGEK